MNSPVACKIKSRGMLINLMNPASLPESALMSSLLLAAK